MNYIIIAVVTIVIFIMIFVAFASDDREDEIGYLADEGTDGGANEENQKVSEDNTNSEPERLEEVSFSPNNEQTKIENIPNTTAVEDDSNLFQQLSDEEEKQQTAKVVPAEITRIHPVNTIQESSAPLLEVGTEDDLRLRLILKQNLAKPIFQEKSKCVAAVVQLRFPEDVIRNSTDFVNVLAHAEKVFEKPFTFEFDTYQGAQFNRIWIFEPSEGRDVIIESLIDAYEVTIRFRKALENDKVLKDNKVKIAVGLSAGEMTFISRGVNSEPSMFGKPIYLAETLAEIVGDFGIYVDSTIHNATIPLFDFREWKPTIVRATLPAIPLFELVGWNKPDEIAQYIKHEDASARRAVA
ncbi:MAG: hypothetical protein IKP71_12380, partial [Candidatus Riflebacteria bacterium]|nr:hypothetical protein [Candidatus Riflebacteria bacterium]